MKKLYLVIVLAASMVSTAALAEGKAEPKRSKKVVAEVLATLDYTECVAKLVKNGLGATEARRLCVDSLTN